MTGLNECYSCGRECSTDDFGIFANDGNYYCGHCCDLMIQLEDSDETPQISN